MSQMINYSGELLRISPNDNKKLEFSKNNGLSWNQRFGGSSNYGKFLDLMDNGKEILATTEKGLFFSTNNGLSWNVRKVDEMRNRFIECPDDNDIKEIGEYFCLQDADVVIDSSDVQDMMDGAENAIVLNGKATGNNRCADAIEDAVLHTYSVAEEYNLFSADKVILFIFSPKTKPMLMSEYESINTFEQKFHPDTQCKWGFAEKDSIQDMRIVIIASNLKKRV